MKRPLLAGTFGLLGTAAVLLLAASIFYSCRTGGNPHHSGSASALDAPPPQTDRSAKATTTSLNAERMTMAYDEDAVQNP